MIFTSKFRAKTQGFSLVEMAVVIVILGLVLSTLLLPLQAQRNQVFQTQTENTLEVARRALLGFAQAHGRLPCPAIANGIEDPIPVTGICTSQWGFLPAATLGIQPTNSNGLAIDGWNNPIRYAISTASSNSFTTVNGMSNTTIAALEPDLRVCTDSSVTNCSAATYLINNAVAVIFSTGPTAGEGAGGPDEVENLDDNDTIFVSQTPISTAGNEFDHLLVWISPYVLYNAMIEAGQLH
ncbi:MAG TPA: type II secretion system protein [Methylophilaceae bacterium]|nr:type II secretion system protein [Methylophilaceae bacterium]